MLTVATWNVNSVRARLERVRAWLKKTSPDIVLLQETKATEDVFPREALREEGYTSVVVGQKSYNGVAVLSKLPMEEVTRTLPDEKDEAPPARYLEVQIENETLPGLLVGCVYAPNGNPIDSDKFPAKLDWMKRLETRVRELRAKKTPFLLGGDFNVAPHDVDVSVPANFADDALCQPESRTAYRRILNHDLIDAYRILYPETPGYTFWDYKNHAWEKNRGLRIDHLLLAPPVADHLKNAGVNRNMREGGKPSDHAPLWCQFS